MRQTGGWECIASVVGIVFFPLSLFFKKISAVGIDGGWLRSKGASGSCQGPSQLALDVHAQRFKIARIAKQNGVIQIVHAMGGGASCLLPLEMEIGDDNKIMTTTFMGCFTDS